MGLRDIRPAKLKPTRSGCMTHPSRNVPAETSAYAVGGARPHQRSQDASCGREAEHKSVVLENATGGEDVRSSRRTGSIGPDEIWPRGDDQTTENPCQTPRDVGSPAAADGLVGNRDRHTSFCGGFKGSACGKNHLSSMTQGDWIRTAEPTARARLH